jgi:hypothetical protein
VNFRGLNEPFRWTSRIDLSQPAAQLPLVLPGAVIPAKQPFSFAGVESGERQQKELKCAF